jgi:hypothetical protein
MSEVARRRIAFMCPTEKREMTAAARSKRWIGHTPLRALKVAERRSRKRDYMRRYREGIYA